MPEATHTLPLDPVDFSPRFAAAALAAGFTEEKFGEINGHPLLAYTKPTETSRPKIYLSTGIHGDEPEGIHALIRFVSLLESDPEVARGYCLFIYPVCNKISRHYRSKSGRLFRLMRFCISYRQVYRYIFDAVL
jgi:hypothetical protein